MPSAIGAWEFRHEPNSVCDQRHPSVGHHGSWLCAAGRDRLCRAYRVDPAFPSGCSPVNVVRRGASRLLGCMPAHSPRHLRHAIKEGREGLQPEPQAQVAARTPGLRPPAASLPNLFRDLSNGSAPGDFCARFNQARCAKGQSMSWRWRSDLTARRDAGEKSRRWVRQKPTYTELNASPRQTLMWPPVPTTSSDTETRKSRAIAISQMFRTRRSQDRRLVKVITRSLCDAAP